MAENNQKKFPKNYPPYRVFWNWELTHDCNYQCSYCPTWCDEVKTPRYLSVPEWEVVWDRMFELYYSGVVRYAGGEPSVYPHFEEIVGVVAEKHSVDITTNISFNLQSFIEYVDPANVAISASYHPEVDNIDEFVQKIIFLNKNGFVSSICFVGYPPHLSKLKFYKSIAEDNGIMFKFLPFNGKFNGREYPVDYTEEEKKLMKESASGSHDEKANEINTTWYEWNVEKRDNKEETKLGKLCRMGQMYAIIGTDGTVKRCCSPEAEIIGNIFERDFKLLDEPKACNVEHCPCFKSMIVGEENIWSSLWEGLPHKKYK